MSKRVALVTGGNRGIGYEVCRQLAANSLQVVLGARRAADGRRAADALRASGCDVEFCPLDVADAASVSAARQIVEQQYGRLDVLVNNAGIYIDEDQSAFDVPLDTVRQTLEVNLFGAYETIRAFMPLMRRQQYGRVVNVSSGMGAFDEMGGGSAGYRLSKTALNSLTRMMANELEGTNIKVNAACPGWVRTDMGGADAPRDVATGADTIVWLALLPDDGPSGRFFRDRQPIAW
ncbi:MAG: SDR family NAD(P)-dependent oxidoreductase [Chloroflexi bacterium]|nr:SDR family NAD(P)-dependent oxidoreductase [Chloroflexota bacterium]